MKITAKSRYALLILLDIAVNGGAEPRTIKEIASEQGLSEKFISRIVVTLRRAGLINSARGVNGGLRLARFPDKITLLEIVEATDNSLALVHCLARPGACKRQGRCAAELAWARANDALVGALGAVKLSSIVADSRRLSPPEPQEPDYCI